MYVIVALFAIAVVVSVVVLIHNNTTQGAQGSTGFLVAPSGPAADAENKFAAPTDSPTDLSPEDAVLSEAGKALIASDDFDGPQGSAPNPDAWDYDLGGGGWGNDEKQTYTKDPTNVRLSGDGNLLIDLLKNGDSYTSARLVTRGKADFDHGLFEARIKFPEGQGIHPAMWLLGSNIESVDYPACGEIDVLEIVNTGTQAYSAIHGPQTDNAKHEWQQVKRVAGVYSGVDLAQDYHVYQVFRAPDKIVVGIDGRAVARFTHADIPAGAKWVFDAPMYLTLNIAVGGEWPGPVAPDTKFPATMMVDWVKLWQ
jgi:beta-glucanase (GH16 family)